MFNTGVIELIILLAFTYFIASLMLSSLNEAIAAGFNTRGKDLKYILENMFKSQQWKSYISDQFYDSAHIQSLIIKSNRLPSYIPVDKFILTIMDYIKREDYRPEKIEKGIEEFTK